MPACRSVVLSILVSLVFVLGTLGTTPVNAADNIVGTGTPQSCTETAFDAVFFALPSSGGTISFNCGKTPVTILFTSRKNVSSNTVIDGENLVTLSGSNTTGIFQVFFGQSLTLNQITLTRGLSASGAVENFGTLTINSSQILNNTSTGSGGGITNQGALVLNNSVVSANSASAWGGGVYSDGQSAAITNTRFSGNSAVEGGGGVAVFSGSMDADGSFFSENQTSGVFAQGGALVLTGTSDGKINASEFSTNRSSRGGAISVLAGSLSIFTTIVNGNWGSYGGGIRQEGGTLTLNQVTLEGNGYAPNGSKVNTGGGALSWGNGTAELRNVTIANNWASYGGGFDHDNGTTTLINVTISGNQAVGSGGFDLGGGSVSLVNTTIVGNSAPFFSGGIGNRGGMLTVKNSLLAKNLNPDTGSNWNCYKEIGATPFMLSDDHSCRFGSSRDGVDVLLGPMVQVDSYTQVAKPERGSPAIDAGSGIDCPPADQRGVPRPQGAACDIGAVEVTADDLLYRVFLPATMR